MSERQYIGARYVPKFFENPNTGDTTWLSGVAYEALTIVSYAGNSYTSKKPVPAGIGSPNANTEYWASTGIFNAQVEQIRHEISAISDRTDDLEESVGALETDMEKVKHRINGKTVAVYGDSWATAQNGTPWLNYLAEASGNPVHSRAQGAAPLASIYALWDNYNADIYIIEAGLNDCSHDTKGDAFGTALSSFISAIRSVNPNAEIYFLTPPNIDSTTQIQYLFPFEFYRTYVWRMAPILKFNVINGLKITDLAYRDGVHPTEATAVNVGKHIVSAIDTYGDEETHITEFTALARSDNKLLFIMRNGTPYLYFQNYDEVASEAGTGAWAGMYVATKNLTDIMGLSCGVTHTIMPYSGGSGIQFNIVNAFSSDYLNGLFMAWTTASHTVLRGTELELTIPAWQRPMS